MIKGSVLKTFDETYDGTTDNLLSRKRNNGPQETFGYDNFDRLVSVKSGTVETMKINYASNGNILFKTGIGNFSVNFANPIFAQRVSLYSISVIKISMAEAGVHSVTISSTARTPEEQVNAMYNN